MPAPAGVGILILAADDHLGDFPFLTAAEGGGKLGFEAGDGGTGLRPAVEPVAAEDRTAQEGGRHLVEQKRLEDGDRARVFVAPVEVEAAGKSHGTSAIARLGQDKQVGRAGGVGPDVDEAIVAGLQRAGVVRPVTGDIGPVLGIDEAVLDEVAGKGIQLRDAAVDRENPAGDAKLGVSDIDPEAGILDVTEETIAGGDVAVRGEDLGQSGVCFAAEFAPWSAMEVAVEVVEGGLDHGGTKDQRRFGGVDGQAEAIELGAKEFPPLGAVMPVEGEFLGAPPELHALDETRAQSGRRTAEGLGDIGPFQAVEAETDPPVDPRAQVDAPGGFAGVEPAGDLERRVGGPPVRGAVDMEMGRGRVGHEGAGN